MRSSPVGLRVRRTWRLREKVDPLLHREGDLRNRWQAVADTVLTIFGVAATGRNPRQRFWLVCAIFRHCPICLQLPPVASAGLQKRSIPAPRVRLGAQRTLRGSWSARGAPVLRSRSPAAHRRPAHWPDVPAPRPASRRRGRAARRGRVPADACQLFGRRGRPEDVDVDGEDLVELRPARVEVRQVDGLEHEPTRCQVLRVATARALDRGR